MVRRSNNISDPGDAILIPCMHKQNGSCIRADNSDDIER